jgi:ribose transport system permease protein
MTFTSARLPLASSWAATRRFRPVLAITIVLFVLFAATQSGFLTGANIENLLTAISVLWVVSMGMTFVLLTAGADLSVGAIAALTGIFFAKVVSAGVPGWPAVALTLLFGVIIGVVINGTLIGRFQLSFFVVTLASMIALTGVVNLWSSTQSFTVASAVPAELGINSYLGLPAPIWIMIGSFLICLYVQHWTYFGRDVYAVGGSPTAARLSGIRVSRTIIGVYALSALCATVGSLITVGRIGVAAPNVDPNLPLQAIAAVLLGGTSLAGGAGGVGGTALGVLFIGILQNGLSIAGVPSFWQQVVTGLILVLAVLGDRLGFSRAALRRGLATLTRGSPPPLAASEPTVNNETPAAPGAPGRR